MKGTSHSEKECVPTQEAVVSSSPVPLASPPGDLRVAFRSPPRAESESRCMERQRSWQTHAEYPSVAQQREEEELMVSEKRWDAVSFMDFMTNLWTNLWILVINAYFVMYDTRKKDAHRYKCRGQWKSYQTPMMDPLPCPHLFCHA